MFVTTINHYHRGKFNLSLEEYIIAKEIYDNRHVNPMDRVDLIAARLIYPRERVIMFACRPSVNKLMCDGINGFEVSEKWSKNYDMYYPAVI